MTAHPMPRFSAFRTQLLAAFALIVAVAVFAPSPAQAQWVSTQALVDEYCKSEDPEQAAFCVGYIAGSLHVLMAPPQLMPQGQFCVDVDKQPKLTSIAERLVTLRDEREELADTPAFSVIAAIVQRGFPCPDEVLEATQAPPAPAPEDEDATPPEDVFGLPE